jgi:hypothetical protein
MPSLEHERLIHSNTPSPEQLFRLASVGISEANRRRRLKRSPLSREDNRAYYFISELDSLNEHSDEPLEIRHRMAGRMGRKLVGRYNPVWSLKFFDTYWVQQDDEVWQAERTRYRFEWDRSGTLLSERYIRFLRTDTETKSLDIGDAIDNFSFADDEVAIWQAKGELEIVTSEDCELLIGDVRDYYDRYATAQDAA